MSYDVTLKVLEAYTRDVGRGVARIDYDAMDTLDASTGDVIEITGKRKTVAKCLPLYPSDEGRNVIRVDGLVRNNAAVAISDTITIKKIKAPPAEKVIVAPLESIPPIDERYLADALESVPVTKGDNIMIPYFGGRLTFQVIGITPPSDAVLISQRTIFTISEKGDIPSGVPQVFYDNIGGLDVEIDKVQEMIELPLKHSEIFEKLGVEAPKGILLYGPPGTGKTLLAKAVATESSAHFISISGPEIMSKFYGESESRLRDIFKEAKEKSPTIIFIDEIDSIAPKREEVTGEVERRVVSQLLSLMDGLEGRGKVIVIAATNRPNAIDPALRRPGRFDREIEITVPNKTSREDILKIHMQPMPVCPKHPGKNNCGNDPIYCEVDNQIREEIVHEISNSTHGFVGADLEGLCKEAAMKTINRTLPSINIGEEKISSEDIEKIRVLKQDFQKALKEVTPSAMREVFIEIPDISWNEIGGLKEIKEELKQSIEYPLTFRGLSDRGIKTIYEKLRKTLPKGILLYGHPGTGKTLLAKAAASSSEANFISVKGPEIISKWVGESERGIREIFRRARQASPCIIFLDEMDSLASSRQSETSGNHDQKVVSQLLTELDGIQGLEDVIVIGATNRIDMIDPAILRGGRFDKIINVGMPDKEARKEIIKIHTNIMRPNDKRLIQNKENMERIIELTADFTGADIAAIVTRLVTLILARHQKEFKNKAQWIEREIKLKEQYRKMERIWKSTKYPKLKIRFKQYPNPPTPEQYKDLNPNSIELTETEWIAKEEEVKNEIKKMLKITGPQDKWVSNVNQNSNKNTWLKSKYGESAIDKQFNSSAFNDKGQVEITENTINENGLTVRENLVNEIISERPVEDEEIIKKVQALDYDQTKILSQTEQLDVKISMIEKEKNSETLKINEAINKHKKLNQDRTYTNQEEIKKLRKSTVKSENKINQEIHKLNDEEEKIRKIKAMELDALYLKIDHLEKSYKTEIDEINNMKKSLKKELTLKIETDKERKYKFSERRDELHVELEENVKHVYNDFGNEIFEQLNEIVENRMFTFNLEMKDIENAISKIREIKEGKPRELSMPKQIMKDQIFK